MDYRGTQTMSKSDSMNVNKVPAARIHVNHADMERLLILVRGYPCLYDQSHVDHKDAVKIQHVWDNIAIMMGYENMDGVQWKKKWRNQRDSYVKKKREILCGKSSLSAQRARAWPFLSVMSFLDSHLQDTSALGDTGNYEGVIDQEYSNNTSMSDTTQHEAEDVEDTNSWGSFSGVDDSISVPAIKTEASDIQPTHETASIPFTCQSRSAGCLESISSPQLKRQKTDIPNFSIPANSVPVERCFEDAFFESCALRMKKLSPVLQSYVTLQISQIFFNAENVNVTPVDIIPLPSQIGSSQSVSAAGEGHNHCSEREKTY